MSLVPAIPCSASQVDRTGWEGEERVGREVAPEVSWSGLETLCTPTQDWVLLKVSVALKSGSMASECT